MCNWSVVLYNEIVNIGLDYIADLISNVTNVNG
jgi:hypothetical protein